MLRALRANDQWLQMKTIETVPVVVVIAYIFRNFNQYIFTKFNNKNKEEKKETEPQGHALAKRTCGQGTLTMKNIK